MPYISSPGESISPKQFEKILKILLVDGGRKWNKPLAAGELSEIGRQAFETLFYQPPLGPIPEYLKPYGSVHGCVAEYEEKVEELEQWKVLKLELWLQDKVGKTFAAGDKVYELSRDRGQTGAPDKYWLKVILARG
jgi:hypothetical protein